MPVALTKNPVWPTGPKICPATNLPAFETRAALRAFRMANGPSVKVLREGLCGECGHWHMATSAPDPAGASSGMGRSAKG